MLRLAHRILSQKLGFMPDAYISSYKATIASMWNTTQTGLRANEPVIIADNVAVYVNNLYRDLKTAPKSYASFPPCPPPFRRFFVEWNCPEGIRYPGDQTFRDVGVLQAGAYVCVFDTVPLEIQTRLRSQIGNSIDAILTATRWQIVCLGYICLVDGRAIPVDLVQVLLDAGGRYLQAFGQNLLQGSEGEQPISGAEAVVMMTLGLMQCKNVNRVEVTQDEGPPQKWCRRLRLPEIRYHMLKIDPNLGRRIPADERITEGDRSGKAFHICRGHFAHFVDDNVSLGLFGRRQYGTFWIPAHTRGSLKHGQIVSTYEVKSPCNS